MYFIFFPNIFSEVMHSASVVDARLTSDLCSLEMEQITTRLIRYSLAHCLHMWNLSDQRKKHCL